MLVLSRKNEQAVIVGASSSLENILKVTVLEISGGSVRLGFDANKDVIIYREELWDRICADGRLGRPRESSAALKTELDRWADDGGDVSHDPPVAGVRLATASATEAGTICDTRTHAPNGSLSDHHKGRVGVVASWGSGSVGAPPTRANRGSRNQAWFALADVEQCGLFHCSLTESGRHHVMQQDAFENTLPEQKRARPMSGTGASHHDEDRVGRFAGEIVEWLQKKAKEHPIEGLRIFALPRMLGALRKTQPGSLKWHLEELKEDLMRLMAGQLAKHPMIRDLVRAVRDV